MREFGGDVLFSATDLTRFTGCPHSTALDLAHPPGEGPEPGGVDGEEAELLRRRGDAHEAEHLKRLELSGRTVVEIARADPESAAAATRDALARGAEVVYRGALLSRNWVGRPDFLERVGRPSALGSFSYEVADARPTRGPHPRHVLRLVLHSDLLADVQGAAPEFAHIELGTGERAPLRLADYTHCVRAARARLEAFAAGPEPTRPVPCPDCGTCRWAGHCAGVWRSEDSLFRVAGIGRGQVRRLEAAGIGTMEALASLDRPVRGMADGTRLRLAAQARLQHARKTGGPAYELREPEPGRGFDLPPEPRRGDIFYDIEGDPHHEGGLEYLHGVLCDGRFRAFWAHDRNGEAKATADLLEFIGARLEAHPEARIHHYAPYEITALRRLTARHGTGEAFLDRLLRERRFVDLYAVVRGGPVCSEESYSIKSMEAFYGRAREGGVTTGGGSIAAYGRWRETGDRRILDGIGEYNRIDCVSTEELRDWLVSIRPEGPWPRTARDTGEGITMEDDGTRALRGTLAASGLPRDRRDALLNLGLFHRREERPGQWAVFDSVGRDGAELAEDPDALAGLEATGPAEPAGSATARAYRFTERETGLRSGGGATVTDRDGPPATVSVGTVDRFQGQEAPVCLVSMTASSVGETARGMEFPLSPNRVNVAVSHARGLALVFGAPRLRDARCGTVGQMRLVNTLCGLDAVPIGSRP